MKKLLLSIALLTVSLIAQGKPPVVINSYDVEISVKKNADILVKEAIEITTDGQKIKRGIFRDFLTRYQTPLGYRSDIDYQLISIERDGMKEPYHVDKTANGIRVYIGHSDRLLPPGTYRYHIIYIAKRALGFFDDHDELYWNVTGNVWAFPILKASARIILPEQTKISKTTAYTGISGARGRDYKMSYPEANEVLFTTTRTLPPGNGLTVVVGWPKGVINAPDAGTKMGDFLADNHALVFAILGYLLLVLFYSLSWFYLGRDPEIKTVIPLFEPPQGFSPQALRYIKKMRYDNKMFTAALINMAIKQHIKIEEKPNKDYVLKKISDDTSQLTQAEQAISKELFSKANEVKLVQKNHQTLSAAIKRFKTALVKEFRDKHFKLNSPVILFSFIITLASLFPAAIESLERLFFMTAVSITTFIVAEGLLKLFSNIKHGEYAFKTIVSSIAGVIFTFVFVLMFAEQMLRDDWAIYIMVILFIATNAVFIDLIRKPTPTGAKIINQTEGFAMYLKATEKDRMNFRNPPDKTPELFERYLPYALALGLEQAWAIQFAEVLVKTQYQPGWYTGKSYSSFTPVTFSGSIGNALNTAIASSSSAPGSSSGFGSGGSSGGGGGGGGGGGW